MGRDGRRKGDAETKALTASNAVLHRLTVRQTQATNQSSTWKFNFPSSTLQCRIATTAHQHTITPSQCTVCMVRHGNSFYLFLKDHKLKYNSSSLPKIFEMVDEVRQLATFIHFFTCRHDAFCEWTRPTAEHSNLAYLQTYRPFYTQPRPKESKSTDFKLSSFLLIKNNGYDTSELFKQFVISPN
jgi:hypothetical protein